MPSAPQSAIANQLGNTNPGATGRRKPAAYTSPVSKERIVFDWEITRRRTPLRKTPFEFPGINDAYVQQNGFGARQYPLSCIFWGPSHDRMATAFEKALIEPGVGELEHPLYGTFKVTPVGDVDRVDDPKNAGNQTIVDVVFWTTTGIVYPSSKISARNEIEAALAGFRDAGAQNFNSAAKMPTTVSQENVKATIRKYLQTVRGALQKVADSTSKVNKEFRDYQRLLNSGLDVLIGQPILLAQQISNLITAPGRAVIAIGQRLQDYHRLAMSIMSSTEAIGTQLIPGIPETGVQLSRLRLKEANDFHTSDLFTMNAIAGSVTSALETTYQTRNQAVLAAATVMAQFEEVIAWRDQRLQDIEQADTGESYQALHEAVSLVAGYLVQSSATLAVERRVMLDRARTIVDVCAELYGSVDDRLDFLINTNNLSGSELLELPKGRVVRYYV